MENRSSHSVSKSSHLVIAKISKKNFLLEIAELSNLGLKKFFHQKTFYRTLSNFVMGCVWSRRPIKNLSSHSVLKSSDSYKKSSHSANFDIGRLWSRRPMENRSSHSVLKSSDSYKKSSDSYKKSSHQKYFLTDVVKFHYGLPM